LLEESFFMKKDFDKIRDTEKQSLQLSNEADALSNLMDMTQDKGNGSNVCFYVAGILLSLLAAYFYYLLGKDFGEDKAEEIEDPTWSALAIWFFLASAYFVNIPFYARPITIVLSKFYSNVKNSTRVSLATISDLSTSTTAAIPLGVGIHHVLTNHRSNPITNWSCSIGGFISRGIINFHFMSGARSQLQRIMIQPKNTLTLLSWPIHLFLNIPPIRLLIGTEMAANAQAIRRELLQNLDRLIAGKDLTAKELNLLSRGETKHIGLPGLLSTIKLILLPVALSYDVPFFVDTQKTMTKLLGVYIGKFVTYVSMLGMIAIGVNSVEPTLHKLYPGKNILADLPKDSVSIKMLKALSLVVVHILCLGSAMSSVELTKEDVTQSDEGINAYFNYATGVGPYVINAVQFVLALLALIDKSTHRTSNPENFVPDQLISFIMRKICEMPDGQLVMKGVNIRRQVDTIIQGVNEQDGLHFAHIHDELIVHTNKKSATAYNNTFLYRFYGATNNDTNAYDKITKQSMNPLTQ